jgi:hypothetical protein
VTLRTGIPTADGHEEVLREYMCDWPDCPNMGVRLLGSIAALRAVVMVCEEHAPASSNDE